MPLGCGRLRWRMFAKPLYWPPHFCFIAYRWWHVLFLPKQKKRCTNYLKRFYFSCYPHCLPYLTCHSERNKRKWNVGSLSLSFPPCHFQPVWLAIIRRGLNKKAQDTMLWSPLYFEHHCLLSLCEASFSLKEKVSSMGLQALALAVVNRTHFPWAHLVSC